MRIFFLLTTIVLFACSGDKTENPTDSENVVYGQVTSVDTQEPLSGALITIRPQGSQTTPADDTTDETGFYHFEDLREGLLDITVDKIGYKVTQAQVHHDGGETLRDFALRTDTTNTKQLADSPR